MPAVTGSSKKKKKKKTTTKEERENGRLRTAACRQRKEESEAGDPLAQRARLDSENAKRAERRQRAKAKKEQEEAAAEAKHQEQLARRRERDRATYARKKMEQSGNTPGRGGGGRPPTHPTQPTPNNNNSLAESQDIDAVGFIQRTATNPDSDPATVQFALFLARDISIEKNERAGINQAHQQNAQAQEKAYQQHIQAQEKAYQQNIQAQKNVSQRQKQGLAEIGRSTIRLDIDADRYAGLDPQEPPAAPFASPRTSIPHREHIDSAPVEEEENQNPTSTPLQPAAPAGGLFSPKPTPAAAATGGHNGGSTPMPASNPFPAAGASTTNSTSTTGQFGFKTASTPAAGGINFTQDSNSTGPSQGNTTNGVPSFGGTPAANNPATPGFGGTPAPFQATQGNTTNGVPSFGGTPAPFQATQGNTGTNAAPNFGGTPAASNATTTGAGSNPFAKDWKPDFSGKAPTVDVSGFPGLKSPPAPSTNTGGGMFGTQTTGTAGYASGPSFTYPQAANASSQGNMGMPSAQYPHANMGMPSNTTRRTEETTSATPGRRGKRQREDDGIDHNLKRGRQL